MKKSYRIGIALIMVLMMIFTSSGMVFAANESKGEKKAEPASFTDQEVPDVEQGAVSEEILGETQEDLSASDEEIDEDSPEMLKGNSLSEVGSSP